MNEKAVVDKMLAFIETKERELQASKMSADSHAKTDIVKTIMDELEREIANENN